MMIKLTTNNGYTNAFAFKYERTHSHLNTKPFVHLTVVANIR